MEPNGNPTAEEEGTCSVPTVAAELVPAGIDRISDLPDPILETILSYLPIKYAVATSVLSTRWRNLSPFSAPDHPLILELNDSMLFDDKKLKWNFKSSNFADFVDKLFNKTLPDLPTCPTLDTVIFCFTWGYGDDNIVEWIRSALQLNVKHLYLRNKFDKLNSAPKLFEAIHGCNSSSLETLILGRDIHLWIPQHVRLQNLSCLSLHEVTINENSFTQVVNSCPLLEDLSLVDCTLCENANFRLHSPVLKKLTILDLSILHCYRLRIDVPNLQVFECSGFSVRDCRVSRFHSLIETYIDSGEPSVEQLDRIARDCCSIDDFYQDHSVAELVIACSTTYSLHLSAWSIQALVNYSKKRMYSLPVFEKLTCLILGSLGCKGWSILAILLRNAPNLERLTFQEGIGEGQGGYQDFIKSSGPKPPICLELHTRTITFEDFEGKEDEIKLLEYVLKNGNVLEEVKLSSCIPSLLETLPCNSKIVFESRKNVAPLAE